MCSILVKNWGHKFNSFSMDSNINKTLKVTNHHSINIGDDKVF